MTLDLVLVHQQHPLPASAATLRVQVPAEPEHRLSPAPHSPHLQIPAGLPRAADPQAPGLQMGRSAVKIGRKIGYPWFTCRLVWLRVSRRAHPQGSFETLESRIFIGSVIGSVLVRLFLRRPHHRLWLDGHRTAGAPLGWPMGRELVSAAHSPRKWMYLVRWPTRIEEKYPTVYADMSIDSQCNNFDKNKIA
jgi:hypothetical protein